MILYLVCDISGSMEEDAKPFVMRTAVLTVAQWVRLGYGRAEIRLCAWGPEARCLPNWSVKDEYPAEFLACNGTSNGEALIQLLGKVPDGKVMIFSDGFWSCEDEKSLGRWRGNLPPNALRIVKIGADANPDLKGADVFTAEEMFAALDGLLEGSPA